MMKANFRLTNPLTRMTGSGVTGKIQIDERVIFWM